MTGPVSIIVSAPFPLIFTSEELAIPALIAPPDSIPESYPLPLVSEAPYFLVFTLEGKE